MVLSVQQETSFAAVALFRCPEKYGANGSIQLQTCIKQ
jgi:hypothetical protein